MTNEGKRNQIHIEFENTYFSIDDDIEQLISSHFGLKGESFIRNLSYIEWKAQILQKLSQALYFHIKMANSLYPTSKEQLEKRKMHQKYAAGACYGIVTMYEQIFHHLHISVDKHTEKIQHIRKEINSIKAWRESDAKRFKYL